MGDSLFREIQRKRTINIIVASLAVLVLAVSSYFLYSKVFRAYADPVDVSGNSITFNSGYYTVDSSGNVYSKTGSEIADTPDDIYPFVSYLSEPYLDDGSQLNIYDKDVTVGGTATLLMEGHQTFSDLTIATGGTISQPQPDRAGYINRYLYSDQEWAIEFLGFVKVPDGESRKVTCATDYDTGDGGDPIGNGCIVSYHPAETDLDEIATDEWTDLDKVWQTGTTAWDSTRYGALGSITNASGSDKYYPIRIIFKDDYIDNRDENMEVYLRDGTGAIIDQAGAGSSDPIEFAGGTFYGATSGGTVDVATSGESRFQYYLLDEYVATVAVPTLGWISDDLTNAYKTYTNNEVTLSSFFDNSYGEDQDGYFDLIFDDHTAWDGTYASSPFAKGTTNAIDEEAYKNYAYSAKTINPNITAGLGDRYEGLGLEIVITSGSLNFNGGTIDLEGKGYPGYSYEMRTQAETATFRTNRGAGPEIDSTIYGGGATADVLAQAGVHTTSGGGYDSNAYGGGANSSVYDSINGPLYAGSGGGSSGSANMSSHGGNGGGYLRISANNIEINSVNTAIRVDGDGGYRVGAGADYYAGGSGGSVYITANTLNNATSYGSGQYFAEADGGSAGSGAGYTGGSGGLIRIVMADYQISGSSTSSTTTISDATSIANGDGDTAGVTFGADGERYVVINADMIQTIDPINPSKQFTVAGEPATSVQVGDTGQLTVTVDGMLDQTHASSEAVDLVVMCDLSGSMVGTKLDALKIAAGGLIDDVISRNGNGGDIRLGLGYFKGSESPPSLGFVSKDSTFLNAYRILLDSWTADDGTNAGAGLEVAWNHLNNIIENASASDSARKKYIIFITDGAETIAPWITGTQTALPGGVPSSGSTLYKINQSGIGLLSVGIGSVLVGNPSYSLHDIFLNEISEYARPVDYEGQVYFPVEGDGSDLSDSLLSALDQIVAETSGMAYTLTETLPAGIGPDDVNLSKIVINGIEYGGDSGSICTKSITTSTTYGNRVQLSCDIPTTFYDSSLYGNVSFEEYQFDFVFNIDFARANIGLVDLDQNAVCSSSSEFTYNTTSDSYVTYNPVGSYLGQNRVRTDAYCLSIIPQITIKKKLEPFYGLSGDAEILERFNPYSVMGGDQLLVTITASPVVPGVETIIKDELLSGSNYSCQLIDNSDQTSRNQFVGERCEFDSTSEAGKVIFTFSLASATSAELKYICQIK